MASSASSREDTDLPPPPRTPRLRRLPVTRARQRRSLSLECRVCTPTPAAKSSASSKPIDAIHSKLARWRCKGGKEMWMLTE